MPKSDGWNHQPVQIKMQKSEILRNELRWCWDILSLSSTTDVFFFVKNALKIQGSIIIFICFPYENG